MDFWKALGKFLLGVVGIVGALFTIFQLGVRPRVTDWVIPSWILLMLIVLLFSITGFTAYWVSRGSGEQTGIADFVQKKKPKLKPSKEIMFIMSWLAEMGDLRLTRSILSEWYMDVFKGKSIKDFNLVMNELAERAYVSSCGLHPGDECLITRDGLSYYQKHRKKFEPIGGPPIGPEKKEGAE